MFNTHDEIIKLEKLITKYSKERKSKIENANYILVTQLQKIKSGELKSVEDIAKWDFEMIRTGELVEGICGEKVLG